jgi:hypothetical protein
MYICMWYLQDHAPQLHLLRVQALREVAARAAAQAVKDRDK